MLLYINNILINNMFTNMNLNMYNKYIDINKLPLFNIGFFEIVNRKNYSYYNLSLIYNNFDKCKELLNCKLPKQYKDHTSNELLLELFIFIHNSKQVNIFLDYYNFNKYYYNFLEIKHYFNMEIVYTLFYSKAMCKFYLNETELEYYNTYIKLKKSILPLYKEFKDVFDAFYYTIKHLNNIKYIYCNYEYTKDHKHCKRYSN